SRAMAGRAMSFTLGCSVPVMFLWIPEVAPRVKQDLHHKRRITVPAPRLSAPRNLKRNALYAGKGYEMARIYKTRAWHDQLSPSLEELELLAMEIYANLPEAFRKLTGEIVIQMSEFPTEEIMDDLALESPFDLLGLFEGRGIAERWNPDTGVGPNRITLYRRAILDYWSE